MAMKPLFVDIVFLPETQRPAAACTESGLLVSFKSDPKNGKALERAFRSIQSCGTKFSLRCAFDAIGNQRAGSLNQTQQTGINSVAIAAIHATAENPDASKADAEIVATAAMPT